MKLLLFSDIHGNQYAFREFLKEIGGIDYDAAIFCGDVFGYYYGQEEIVKGLSQIEKLIAVKGNHDLYAQKAFYGRIDKETLYVKYGHSYGMIKENVVKYTEKCPLMKRLNCDGVSIGIMHGTPLDYLEDRIYPKDEPTPEQTEAFRSSGFDVVIGGHTHFRSDRIIGGVRYINPGSLGQQRDGLGFCYAVFDTKTGGLEYKTLRFDFAEIEEECRRYDPENPKQIEILHRGEK